MLTQTSDPGSCGLGVYTSILIGVGNVLLILQKHVDVAYRGMV